MWKTSDFINVVETLEVENHNFATMIAMQETPNKKCQWILKLVGGGLMGTKKQKLKSPVIE